MQRDIQHHWSFNQPLQIVWDYLTIPELMAQWLMENDFQPVVGRRFRFWSGARKNPSTEGAAFCEVLEIIPFHRLSYSWKGSLDKGATTFDSIVLWTLNQTANGTELQLKHSGFEAIKDYTVHNEGWTQCGKKLTERLNNINNDAANL